MKEGFIILRTKRSISKPHRKEERSTTDTTDTGDCPEFVCPCCTNSLQRRNIHYRHYRHRRLSSINVSLLYKLIAKKKDPLHTLQTQTIVLNYSDPVV